MDNKDHIPNVVQKEDVDYFIGEMGAERVSKSSVIFKGEIYDQLSNGSLRKINPRIQDY